MPQGTSEFLQLTKVASKRYAPLDITLPIISVLQYHPSLEHLDHISEPLQVFFTLVSSTTQVYFAV